MFCLNGCNNQQQHSKPYYENCQKIFLLKLSFMIIRAKYFIFNYLILCFTHFFYEKNVNRYFFESA